GNTGLLTCTGEMATLCLRHMIPVFCIVSARGSIDDHKVYQEVQGRRTIPLLQAYDYPYKIIDKEDEIDEIPDAYEWHSATKSEDSFYMHGAMGFAASFALGLALAAQKSSVWLFNSDGSLSM